MDTSVVKTPFGSYSQPRPSDTLDVFRIDPCDGSRSSDILDVKTPLDLNSKSSLFRADLCVTSKSLDTSVVKTSFGSHSQPRPPDTSCVTFLFDSSSQSNPSDILDVATSLDSRSQSSTFREDLSSRSNYSDISDVNSYVSGISKANPKTISSRYLNSHTNTSLYKIDRKYEIPDEITDTISVFKVDNSSTHVPDNTPLFSLDRNYFNIFVIGTRFSLIRRASRSSTIRNDNLTLQSVWTKK